MSGDDERAYNDILEDNGFKKSRTNPWIVTFPGQRRSYALRSVVGGVIVSLGLQDHDWGADLTVPTELTQVILDLIVAAIKNDPECAELVRC